MKRRINRRKLCGELRDLWRLCGAEDRERLACAEELSAKERLRLFCLACAYGCEEAGLCLCALGVKDLEEMRADGARRKALGRFRGIYPRVASLGGAGGAACAGLPRRPRRIAALKEPRPAHGKHFPCAFCISVKNFFFASTVLTDVNFLCIVERTKSAARGRRRFA